MSIKQHFSFPKHDFLRMLIILNGTFFFVFSTFFSIIFSRRYNVELDVFVFSYFFYFSHVFYFSVVLLLIAGAACFHLRSDDTYCIKSKSILNRPYATIFLFSVQFYLFIFSYYSKFELNFFYFSVVSPLIVGAACLLLRIDDTYCIKSKSILNRPLGIRLITSGLVSLYSCIYSYLEFSSISYSDYSFLLSLFTSISIFVVIISLIACYGLWSLRQWGRILMIVTCCMAIILLIINLSDLIELSKDAFFISLLQIFITFHIVLIFIAGSIIWYLSRTATKQFFIETSINRQHDNQVISDKLDAFRYITKCARDVIIYGLFLFAMQSYMFHLSM